MTVILVKSKGMNFVFRWILVDYALLFKVADGVRSVDNVCQVILLLLFVVVVV